MTRRTLLGLADDVEAGHGRAAGVGPQQRGQDPRPWSSCPRRSARAGPARCPGLDLEVDAVERADLALARAVDLDQAFGGNRCGDDGLLEGRLARRLGRPGLGNGQGTGIARGSPTGQRREPRCGVIMATVTCGTEGRPSLGRRVSLALVLHNHQPVGNFGWVIADAYEHAYEPLIAALERHPHVRLSLHYSGPLLDWLRAERPEFLERVGAARRRRPGRAARRRVLRADPRGPAPARPASASSHDGRGNRADQRPAAGAGRGSPSASGSRTCRVSLADAGYGWTILDDAHFRAASVDESKLWGSYTTDDQGRRLTVFASAQGLRYRMPFGTRLRHDRVPPRACDRGRRPARGDGRRWREVRLVAGDVRALLGRGPLGGLVLRGAGRERRLARARDAQPVDRARGPIGRVYVPTSPTSRWANGRSRQARASPSSGARAGGTRAQPRGPLAARRLLAQLPGQVPRDQRAPQADAADLGQGRSPGPAAADSAALALVRALPGPGQRLLLARRLRRDLHHPHAPRHLRAPDRGGGPGRRCGTLGRRDRRRARAADTDLDGMAESS